MTDYYDDEEKAIYDVQQDLSDLNEYIRQMQKDLTHLMKILEKYDDKKEEQ